jgi:hypothetical protein
LWTNTRIVIHKCELEAEIKCSVQKSVLQRHFVSGLAIQNIRRRLETPITDNLDLYLGHFGRSHNNIAIVKSYTYKVL